jgi:DNA (cytosine-5)-methyltransferase 1
MVAAPLGSHQSGSGQRYDLDHETYVPIWRETDQANAPHFIDQTGTLNTNKGQRGGIVASDMQVRRLTCMECERLQGMPDHHTRIPWRNKPAQDCPDGPRYKAIGNSMAVPVMRWIGERIAMVADCIGYLDDGGP